MRQPRRGRHNRQQSKRSDNGYHSVPIRFTQREPHSLLDGSMNHSVYASGSRPHKPPQRDGPQMGNIADTTTQATLFRRISPIFRCSKPTTGSAGFQPVFFPSAATYLTFLAHCPPRIPAHSASPRQILCLSLFGPSLVSLPSPLPRSAHPPPPQLLPCRLRLKLSS